MVDPPKAHGVNQPWLMQTPPLSLCKRNGAIEIILIAFPAVYDPCFTLNTHDANAEKESGKENKIFVWCYTNRII